MAKIDVANPYQKEQARPRAARSQGLVEFALILPVLLVTIFYCDRGCSTASRVAGN